MVYGNLHIVTLDGLDVTFDGLGQFVFLKSKNSFTPMHIMMQGRTDFVDLDSVVSQPKATRLE